MSKKYDSLGDRMKGYENIARNYLARRIPVIIRVDGKAFHTFTRGMEKPFDRILMTTMQKTMKYLCENIQGCVFGYTQSDEITLVLTDYATITTDAWFGYNIQKMCSVAASMATLAFSNTYAAELWKNFPEAMRSSDNGKNKYIETLVAKMGTAMFDARVFSIPKDEVCNCLIWRQQDATRKIALSRLVMQISVRKNSTARAVMPSKICSGRSVESTGMTFLLIASVALSATKQKLKRSFLFSTIRAIPKWLRSLETVGLSTENHLFSHKKENMLQNGYDTR